MLQKEIDSAARSRNDIYNVPKSAPSRATPRSWQTIHYNILRANLLNGI